MKIFQDKSYPPQLLEEQKILLGLSVMLLLAINFTLNYLAFTYYSTSLLDVRSPGFWITLFNSFFTGGIVLFTKWVFNWSWRDLGITKPKTIWKPLLIAATLFLVLVLFSLFIVPIIVNYSGPSETAHFTNLPGNLSYLIVGIILTWTTTAVLEEVIFRAYLINTLDILLGKNSWSPWIAVLFSSMIFGMIHAYQGLTGILVTASIGFIFGVTFLLHDRRIGPLILVHGAVDTIYLINIYNS